MTRIKALRTKRAGEDALYARFWATTPFDGAAELALTNEAIETTSFDDDVAITKGLIRKLELEGASSPGGTAVALSNKWHSCHM